MLYSGYMNTLHQIPSGLEAKYTKKIMNSVTIPSCFLV